MNHVVVCGGVTYGHTTGHYHALLRTILVVAVDRHLEHLVAIVTAVDAQIQFDITHIQQVTFQIKLDTMVLHGGVVDIVSAVTQRRCYVAREEHVIRFLVEEIELCIQVFGNRELQTEVHCTGALPGQLGVAFVAPYICLLAVYVLYIIMVGKHHVADILITQYTPAQTQLTVLEPISSLGSFHEVLVREVPCSSDRTEVTPAVTFGKLRRTIRTVVGGNQVAVVVVVRYGCQC